jgi:hypothetical protein
MKNKLESGKIVITRGAHALFQTYDLSIYLNRHLNCDWGSIDKEDAKQNDFALNNNERILSVYKITKTITIWIITEWDRSVTTILLPEEY